MIFVDRRKKSSIDRMKTVTSKRYNTHTLHYSVKRYYSKSNKYVITAFCIYDATEKNDTEKKPLGVWVYISRDCIIM